MSTTFDACRLLESIREDVLRRTNGAIAELAVTIDGGTVVLTGTTSRYYHKQLATSAALDVIDGLALQNLIKVASNRTPR